MNDPQWKKMPQLNIIVVDDETMITGYLKALLENYDHRVFVFNDPRQALSQFEIAPDEYDLVITDQSMPGISGIEISTKILALRPELPIILCTGFSDGSTEDKVKSIGIRGFLLKPYKSSELMELITMITNKLPTTA